MTEAIKRVVSDMRREAALWPKTERAQQTARLLNGFADELEAALAAAPASSPPRDEQHDDQARVGPLTNSPPRATGSTASTDNAESPQRGKSPEWAGYPLTWGDEG